MADSTQNGPMQGEAGGGAVVRSTRPWRGKQAAAPARVLSGGPEGPGLALALLQRGGRPLCCWEGPAGMAVGPAAYLGTGRGKRFFHFRVEKVLLLRRCY